MSLSYERRLKQWEKGRFAPAPRPDCSPAQPTFFKDIVMRDGAKLYSEIFLPVGIGDISNCGVPIIVIRSPYPYTRPSRHDKRPISSYVDGGYGVVFQLTRGQGKSEGHFRYYWGDVDDGYDCIDWISAQSWCDGNVGMEGASYLGSTQLLAARSKPPALKCIMPTAFVGNATQCFPFSYGVPNKAVYMQWHEILDAEDPTEMDAAYGDMNAINHPTWGPAFRKRPLIDAADNVFEGDKLESWRQTIANPTDNEFWQSIHFTDEQLAALDLPIFFTDGWYDMTIGPIDFFERLERINPNQKDRYLLVGPWHHSQTGSKSVAGEESGGRILPENGGLDPMEQRLAFFNRYLKGDTQSVVQEDRVRVYISGAPDSSANVWKTYPTFPVPSTQCKRLYLHSQGDARSFLGDGTLTWDAPTDDVGYLSSHSPTDHYTYNPSVPTAFQVESPFDRRDTEVRSDVLTFTSEVFSQPITILGEIVLILHAASDGLDTDWFTVITEVSPDGQSKSFHYAPPAFRARYRDGLDREVLLTPNKPEEFKIPMGPAGHQIAAGSRLRLSIFSSAFPEYDPNANTGSSSAIDMEFRIARQTIYHDVLRPSHVILPVIELD